MTKETIIGLISLLGIILRFFSNTITKFLDNNPPLNKFIINISRGYWSKNKRREKINLDVDRQIAAVGNKHSLNRVTIAGYKYVGKKPFPEVPTLEDFSNFELTVFNEWTDEYTKPLTPPIINQNTTIFASGMMLLHNSEKGYILIDKNGIVKTDGSSQAYRIQQMWGVLKSYRFLLNKKKGIMGGTMALSFIHKLPDEEFTEDELDDIQNSCNKIFMTRLLL